MIRANMGEILKKSRDKYTLVLMSAKAARELIQRDVVAAANMDASAPKDAYLLKDSSKHLSEAVKGIEDGLITLKLDENAAEEATAEEEIKTEAQAEAVQEPQAESEATEE